MKNMALGVHQRAEQPESNSQAANEQLRVLEPCQQDMRMVAAGEIAPRLHQNDGQPQANVLPPQPVLQSRAPYLMRSTHLHKANDVQRKLSATLDAVTKLLNPKGHLTLRSCASTASSVS